MSTPDKTENWDLFDPKWEEKWFINMNEYERLTKDPNPPADFEERIAYHKAQRDEAWDARFQNASEYADHRLIELKKKAGKLKLEWLDVPTADIKTLEEAEQLYSKMNNFIEQQKQERRLMHINKDSELFSKKETSSFNSEILLFKNGILETVDTVVSTQKNGGRVNVCITDLAEKDELSVENNLDSSITMVYNRFLYQEYPNPGSVNWFVHRAPHDKSSESFYQVHPDSYDNNRYNGSVIEPLDELPPAIRTAAINANSNDEGMTKKSKAPEISKPPGLFSGLKHPKKF